MNFPDRARATLGLESPAYDSYSPEKMDTKANSNLNLYDKYRHSGEKYRG